MASIVLYGFDGSTYVRTVRMLLAEKNAQYDLVPVNVLAGEPRQPEHLDRHPFGKVPVLDHDGFRVMESSAIAPYLDEVLPGPSLTPATPRIVRACAWQWASSIPTDTARWSMWRASIYFLISSVAGTKKRGSRGLRPARKSCRN
jgi:glutathione S-transferase